MCGHADVKIVFLCLQNPPTYLILLNYIKAKSCHYHESVDHRPYDLIYCLL